MTHPLKYYELKLQQVLNLIALICTPSATNYTIILHLHLGFIYLHEHGLQQQSSSYVNVKIIKSVLMGAPALGKTAFKSF